MVDTTKYLVKPLREAKISPQNVIELLQLVIQM